jgi:hypothetical protein
MNTNIDPQIMLELELIGIDLNSTLVDTIDDRPTESVLQAIQALKEAIDRGSVKNPSGWLKRAIDRGWIPNSKILKNTPENWLSLAKEYGIVKRMENRGGILQVQENTGHWVDYDLYIKTWTFEYFQSWKQRLESK